jgi:hypothetical protein
VHDQIKREYPDDLLEDHYRLSAWVMELATCYRDRIIIQVIDPQSSLGLFKSLRHWVRMYPTFIVDGHEKVIGWDRAALDAALQARLAGR